MEQEIRKLLSQIVHPETQQSIVESGVLESVTAREDKIVVVLCFAKARDPFAVRIKNLTEKIIADAYPAAAGNITVAIKEGTPRAPQPKRESTTVSVGKIIAVASGKGGVGKSTVTANLALTLRNMGYRVGILDADIYGPSQPKMFGCEEYIPEAVQKDGMDYIIPAQKMDMEIMSIGFFINPNDALMWRGAMATNALKQLLHQTMWGGLDFLLIDMPPGTGDIHLTMISEIKLDGAVIVSTPQQIAVADVVRGVEMFRNEQVAIPVAGIIENMAYFTPEELPDNKYYIFGHGGARKVAEEYGVPFLGEIPIVQSIMEGGDNGRPASSIDERVAEWYDRIAEELVGSVMKNG